MTTKKQEKIKFSKAFWVANTVELFERAAYYGVFIVMQPEQKCGILRKAMPHKACTHKAYKICR